MNLTSVLNPDSPQAQAVLNLFLVTLGIAAVVLVTVTTLVLVSVIRFRRRPGRDAPPRQAMGNTRLEILWTVGPLVILAVLFGVTVQAMNTIDPPVHDRKANLRVTGHQFWWEGHYPKSGVTVANEFHLPVGRTLLLSFRSADVVHDWWVPELGRKVDVFPNHETHLWMKIDRPGTYLGTCDEFCGPEHAWMRIRVVAHTAADFDRWLREQQRPPAAPSSKRARAGAELFMSHTCRSCHTIAGRSSSSIGPDLTHVGSRQTLGAGILENNPASMARWLHNAQAVKPDCKMPNLNLSWPDAKRLAAYLEELR